MKVKALVTIIMSTAVLQGCQMSQAYDSPTASAKATYDDTRPASSQLTEKDAPVKPDHTSDINTGELQFCLATEADAHDVFDKLNRKDALITTEFQKLQRIILRQQQIHADALNNQSTAVTYNTLEASRKLQVNRVLSLFRDRDAIYTRMSFIDSDLEDRCTGKSFSNGDLRSACTGQEARRSFRCTMRF